MVYSITALIACSLFTATACAELDLTPHASQYDVEGMRFQNVTFLDGEKKVTYTPPTGWAYRGNALEAVLSAPNKVQAEVTIRKQPLKASLAFDEGAAKQLATQAAAVLPGGSTNVEIVSQELNPLRINLKDTIEVVLNYSAFGQAFTRSVLFINRGQQQFTFTLDCQKADFAGLHKDFYSSLYSMEGF
jgi:hypothetical protein